MAGFTMRKLCEDIKRTVEEWFKGYPDNIEDGCPNLEYGMHDILSDWNEKLVEHLQSRKDLSHLRWYQIKLVEDWENGSTLSFVVQMTEEHPMNKFYDEDTAFSYVLGDFVYQRIVSQDVDPFSGEHPEREICSGFEYHEAESYMNNSVEDVIKWVESKIQSSYEKICMIDAFLADHTQEEKDKFLDAFTSFFSVTQLGRFDLYDIMDAMWRINFINAWENA